MTEAFETPDLPHAIKGDVGDALAHDSARKHVSGQAVYIDDMPEASDLLHVYIAMSTRANARITALDLSAVRAAPGVRCVLTSDDIPGKNDYSPIAGDDPVFSDGTVYYVGQPLFAVVAESMHQAVAAAPKAKVSYDGDPPIVTIEDARGAQTAIEDTQVMRFGEARAAIAKSAHSVKGRLAIGGQDHFYLEGQVALAVPGEDNDVHVFSSSQNPTEVQHVVGRVLGVPSHAVTVEVRRMGGGFGGKETQPSLFAVVAALAAVKTRRPVKVRLDRDDDMIMTGKRHEFEIDYHTGFDQDGRLEGTVVSLASRCGYSADLSMAINDRAMFHADNAYFLKAAEIVSHRFRTHTVSNTAFRGFGGPQGMMGIERVMDLIAQSLGKDPLDVRKINLYGTAGRDRTPYGQTVEDNILPELIEDLETLSDYRARRQAVGAFNDGNAVLKKGIALTPVKFGISFTATHLNQAGALVHVYSDGSVQVNHGGTEMGQGLMVKVAQIVAHEFQIDIDRVKITATRTDKVPNTSATAASSGTDLNGMAAFDACRQIKERLTAFAAERYGGAAGAVTFEDNHVGIAGRRIPFADLVHEAYMARICLWSSGFYRTPKIHYDRSKQQGRPFYYFAYGAAVSEVVIDTLTGENAVLRTDILHDVGRALNPAVDYGQIEGGFVQGLGWLTTEELVYSVDGTLKTHAPSTYKIPTCGDRPKDFRIKIWEKGINREQTVHRSKAVGEPPLMLAISVFSALNQAVQAVADHRVPALLDAPATPERILMAVEDIKQRAGPTP